MAGHGRAGRLKNILACFCFRVKQVHESKRAQNGFPKPFPWNFPGLCPQAGVKSLHPSRSSSTCCTDVTSDAFPAASTGSALSSREAAAGGSRAGRCQGPNKPVTHPRWKPARANAPGLRVQRTQHTQGNVKRGFSSFLSFMVHIKKVVGQVKWPNNESEVKGWAAEDTAEVWRAGEDFMGESASESRHVGQSVNVVCLCDVFWTP